MGFWDWLPIVGDDKDAKVQTKSRPKTSKPKPKSGGFWERTGDIFEANSPQDQWVREQRGQPTDYGESQQGSFVKRNFVTPDSWARRHSNPGQQLKDVGNFSQDVAQSVLKVPETASRSYIEAINDLLDLVPGSAPREEDSMPGKDINDPVRKFLYGKDTPRVETYQERQQGTKKAFEEGSDPISLKSGKDLSGIAAPLSFLGLGFSAGSDIIPVGKPVKVAGELVEQGVKQGVKQAGREIVEQGGKQVFKETGERVGEQVLGNIARKGAGIGVKNKPGQAKQFIQDVAEGGGRAKLPPDIPKFDIEAARLGGYAPPKKVKVWEKIGKSTRGVISEQGQSGRTLAEGLHSSREAAQIMQADILEAMPTVRNLAEGAAKMRGSVTGARAQFEEFVDMVEGRITSNDPLVANAVAEWRAIAPQIRERAAAAGIDVGDLGETYFPHFVDMDTLANPDVYDRAVKLMVANGEANDPADAIAKLEFMKKNRTHGKFGNLDMSRSEFEFDYDKSANALLRYIQGASDRIGKAEIFGPKNESAYELLEGISREGYDAQTAKEMFDIAIGMKNYDPDWARASKAIRKFQAVTKLGTSAIANASQVINTAISGGYGNLLKGYASLATPEGRAFVRSTGVVADSVINGLKQQEGYVGKILSSIAAPGFSSIERLNRSVTALAGKHYADGLATKAARGNEKAIRTLREKLNVKGDIGEVLTPDQQLQAARALVEKTQFLIDPQDLPGWATSPAGRLVAQFRTFSYKQTKFVTDEIIKEAASGNLAPMARLMAALPIGYGLLNLRDEIRGKQQDENQAGWRRVLDAWNAIGGGGLPENVVRTVIPREGERLSGSELQSRLLGLAGGPAVTDASRLAGSFAEAIQGNPEQLERFGFSKIPLVGNIGVNRLFPYETLTDAQQEKINRLKEIGAPKEEIQANEKFYEALKAAGKGRTTTSKEITKLVGDGDMEGARAAAEAYNERYKKAFTKWLEKYPGYAEEQELAELYEAGKINLTDRSIKARQRSAEDKNTYGGYDKYQPR